MNQFQITYNIISSKIISKYHNIFFILIMRFRFLFIYLFSFEHLTTRTMEYITKSTELETFSTYILVFSFHVFPLKLVWIIFENTNFWRTKIRTVYLLLFWNPVITQFIKITISLYKNSIFGDLVLMFHNYLFFFLFVFSNVHKLFCPWQTTKYFYLFTKLNIFRFYVHNTALHFFISLKYHFCYIFLYI